jgi:hypothetical protein
MVKDAVHKHAAVAIALKGDISEHTFEELLLGKLSFTYFVAKQKRLGSVF